MEWNSRNTFPKHQQSSTFVVLPSVAQMAAAIQNFGSRLWAATTAELCQPVSFSWIVRKIPVLRRLGTAHAQPGARAHLSAQVNANNLHNKSVLNSMFNHVRSPLSLINSVRSYVLGVSTSKSYKTLERTDFDTYIFHGRMCDLTPQRYQNHCATPRIL